MARKKNKPIPITTPGYRRTMVIFGLVLALLIIGIGALVAWNISQSTDDAPIMDAEVVEVQEDSESLNTPQHACQAIASYYKSINDKDVKTLRDMGAKDAANALSNNWLEGIGYKMDYPRVANPDLVSSFPSSRGLYAGCTLYKISDFYQSSDTAGAIESQVYGKVGPEGWIYYDPMNARWVIADPTIPTAFAAPENAKVMRLSENKEAYATMDCAGVYSSPWWSWAKAEVGVSCDEPGTSVKVEAATYDAGFTVNVPESLLKGAEKPKDDVDADGSAENGDDNGDGSDGNGNGTGGAGGATQQDQQAQQSQEGQGTGTGDQDAAQQSQQDDPSKASGTCTMWRGDISEFGTEKIGAKPLSVKGDICPVVVSFKDENISPIFVVGGASAEAVAQEQAEAQIDEYGAVNQGSWENGSQSGSSSNREGTREGGESGASGGSGQ